MNRHDNLKRFLVDLRHPEGIQLLINDTINSSELGADTETTGLDYANDYLVGVSLYNPASHTSFYIPVRHPDIDLTDYPTAINVLGRLLETRTLVFHNAAFDLPFLLRDLQSQPQSIRDSQSVANMLQIRETSLKDLVHARGIAPVAEVRRIDDVLKQADAEHYGEIRITKHHQAGVYPCHDAYWAYVLEKDLAKQYADFVGGVEIAESVLRAQYDASLFLASTVAAGFCLDPEILADYVDQFEADVTREEQQHRTTIRDIMGWTPPPNGNPSVSEQMGW